MVSPRLLCSILLALASFRVAAQEQQQFCPTQCPPLDDAGKPIPSLCEGDTMSPEDAFAEHSVCFPNEPKTFSFQQLKALQATSEDWPIIVVANQYVGCNAGRAEALHFAKVARQLNALYPNVKFIASMKGGGSCQAWATLFTNGAGSVPWVTQDMNYAIRDSLFTSPYPHPSYVVLDWDLKIRHKFVGPCCGYERMDSCTAAMGSAGVEDRLTDIIKGLLKEMKNTRGKASRNRDCVMNPWSDYTPCDVDCGQGKQTKTRAIEQLPTGSGKKCGRTEKTRECVGVFDTCSALGPSDCVMGPWSEWSGCSLDCRGSVRMQTRSILAPPRNGGLTCEEVGGTHRVQACPGVADEPCERCINEFGTFATLELVADASDGLSAPRGIAFHPAPGQHLGSRSEGRSFAIDGNELWVANGHSHDVTIITGIDSTTHPPAALTRRDRGLYHYMHNITSLSFNAVASSGRQADRDTFGYFATCQDSNNTYLGLKEPNFFMGPSLYNTDPSYKNLVGQDGGPCLEGDTCYFMHADMLHESPSCIGIVHDPELDTAYGTVYWAFDGWNGHLVRYDFQQPHGPSLMNHAAASVRRYPEVKLQRGPPGVTAGMVVDSERRVLYISNPGSGTVIAVDIDTGSYARDARQEYPIFSSRLPQFEYSVWECVNQRVVASGLDTPAGLALSADGKRLFVLERGTRKIIVLEPESGARTGEYGPLKSTLTTLSSLAISPPLPGQSLGDIFVTDENTNTMWRIKRRGECPGAYVQATVASFDFDKLFADPGGPKTCAPDPVVPDGALFEQVHGDSGYADADESVQDDNQMHAGAAALANRTDCGVTSELNFDALLLGGYFCHTCLPDHCEAQGFGKCSNVWWRGYACEQIIFVSSDPDSGRLLLGNTSATIANGEDAPKHTSIEDSAFSLFPGKKYRFVIDASSTVFLSTEDSFRSIYAEGVTGFPTDKGVIEIQVLAVTPPLYLSSSLGPGMGGLLTRPQRVVGSPRPRPRPRPSAPVAPTNFPPPPVSVLPQPASSPSQCSVTHCQECARVEGREVCLTCTDGQYVLPHRSIPVKHKVSWGFDTSAASLTIIRGDTVEWTFDQTEGFAGASSSHNIVSGADRQADGVFRSPFRSSGTWSYTFNQSGRFPYFCEPHTQMNAVVMVVEPGTCVAECPAKFKEKEGKAGHRKCKQGKLRRARKAWMKANGL